MLPKGWSFSKGWGIRNAWSSLVKEYPAIAAHLISHEEKGKARCDQGDFWWELRACDYYGAFELDKIIYPNICDRNIFTYDSEGLYTNQKCFIIPGGSYALLGVLNSSVWFFLYKQVLPKLRGGFFEPSYVFLKDFSIPVIDVESEKTLTASVKALLEEKNTTLDQGSQAQARTLKIEALEAAIDDLVFKLYGLNEDEIEIIKSQTR